MSTRYGLKKIIREITEILKKNLKKLPPGFYSFLRVRTPINSRTPNTAVTGNQNGTGDFAVGCGTEGIVVAVTAGAFWGWVSRGAVALANETSDGKCAMIASRENPGLAAEKYTSPLVVLTSVVGDAVQTFPSR